MSDMGQEATISQAPPMSASASYGHGPTSAEDRVVPGGWIGYLIAGFIGACLLIWIFRLVRGTRTA
jgi:Transglycosylase associated protein